MTIRVALTDFALKNPFYAGATCTVYQVDPTTLARTTAYATLYAAPTGGTLRANPMTLDSDGKFPTPLYVDQPVILVVKPVAGAVEQLGVQGLAPSRWRGVYTAGTVYYPGERFRSPSSPATYIVLRGFTATSFISDLINPAPLFEQELDADSLLDGVSASLFGSLLPNTPALGYYRINAAAGGIEARTPAQVRSDISALSSGGGTITGDLTLSRTAASASLTIDTSDPRQRYYRISTAGLLRWVWGGGNEAESGANAGSPFTMAAYDDTGALIGTVYQVVRATRQIQLHGAGTAAAPTVSFIGDDDTGFYSPGANQFGFATGGVVRLTLANTVASLATPLLLPASDPTDANHAARKAYVDAATATKLNVANPSATGVMNITASSGNPELRLIRSGVRTWTHYVSDTDGSWGLYDAQANATRLRVDTNGGFTASVAVYSPFVRTTGQVRALGGISFADSGWASNAMLFGWTNEATPSTYVWVNGTGIGKLPHSSNVSSFRSTGDGTSPYLEYVDSAGSSFGARSFASDARMKENIRPITEPFLPRVRAMRPKSFDWRAEVSEGWSSRHNPLGLIAQEVAAAIPSAASLIGEGEKARYHLDPLTLIAALIGAVNELAASNEAQSALIASLHARLGASAGEVTKLAVVDRLAAAGAMPALSAMLDADPPLAAWWQAALVFRVDDPAIIDLVTKIGEDPAVILAPVPAPITRRQLRLWLLRQGKTDADVRAAIGAIPDPAARAAALIEWEDSTSYDRGHPLIAAVGSALGFTAEQIDAGFAAAATI